LRHEPTDLSEHILNAARPLFRKRHSEVARHRADLAAWVQPTGAHDAYPLGAKVTYQGRVYESKIPANVLQPDRLPGGLDRSGTCRLNIVVS
jgi:hypothetical protein